MKILTILTLIVSVFLLTSCTSTASTTNTTKEQIMQTQKSDNPLNLNDSIYSSMMSASLVNKGNNYRIKQFLNKVRSGQKTYIAAIGGSVTEGAGPASFRDGYCYQFNNMFQKKYCPADTNNVFFDGAGLSGTPSMLALLRYKQDVIDVLQSNPDLLIIEFAVNDGGDPLNTSAFEQLIRTALISNNNTAIIVMYAAATYPNTQPQMSVVANYYQIPQVSAKNAITSPISAGFFTNKDYFTDNVHPTKEGHKIMADSLMYLLEQEDKAPIDEEMEIPTTYAKTPNYSNFTNIISNDPHVNLTLGDFNSVDSQTQTLKKSSKGCFKQNFYHKSGAANNSLIIELDCKSFILAYKENGSWTGIDFGIADIYVDGQKKFSLDGGPSGGWNNSVVKSIINDTIVKTHKIEIKMADGSENKGFTILAMGYAF